jgi:hypothetical protein
MRVGTECRIHSRCYTSTVFYPHKIVGRNILQSKTHPMSNFNHMGEQYGAARETKPLLNTIMTDLKTSAYDNPACEPKEGGVTQIASPHTATIVWGAISLLVVTVFTIMGGWIPAIFFAILGVWKINSGLKSAKRRKPQYLPRF